MKDSTTYNAKLFAFMLLTNAWPKLARQHQPLIEQWFPRLYSKPVHCWIVGGHHHGHREGTVTPNSRYRTMVWGTHAYTDLHYPHLGFGLTSEANAADRKLEWFGYSGVAATPVSAFAMPSAARANLQQVRMMLVLGCNAVPFAQQSPEWLLTMGRSWQKWLRDDTSGRLPMLVGWRRTKSMPHDANIGRRFGTDLFARKLVTLAGQDDFLSLFSTPDRIGQVIQCWGSACWQAFTSLPPKETAKFKAQLKLLWTDCAVLAPDRSVFHVNPAFKGQQVDPPFDMTKPLPLMKVGVAP